MFQRHTLNPVLGLVTALGITALGACSAATGARSPSNTPRAADRALAHVIDSITAAPPMQHTAWGIEVLDQQTGEALYRKNSSTHFIPASNTKLVVTTVAMGTLGPDFRYRTPITAANISADGTTAAVLIEGSGDPTFSARFWRRPFAAAEAFADSIYTRGIRRIDGALIIDASRFRDAQINGTWEVGDLPGGSAPPVAAFAMEESMHRVVVSAGASAGAPVTASAPGWPLRAVDAQPVSTSGVTTDSLYATSVLRVDYLSRRDSIRFYGRMAALRADTGSYAVTDAAMYAGRAVAAALEARGVSIRDGVVVATDAAQLARARAAAGATAMPASVATMVSPPLSDIVRAVLHVSQNWIAETLLKTLGTPIGTWTTGLAAERRYLTTLAGLDSLDFNLRDASGLSAQNLLTPHAIVRILEHARTSAWGPAFVSALAAPGEVGTLENRLKEFQGRLRGKTGTISNVATLSGFITTNNGRPVTFVIMTNGTGLSSAIVRRATDDIVRAIARAKEP